MGSRLENAGNLLEAVKNQPILKKFDEPENPLSLALNKHHDAMINSVKIVF